MSFESKPFAREEQLFIGNKEIDMAYERAEDVLSKPIDPRMFTEYKDVEHDIAHVEKMERLFQTALAKDSPEMQRGRKLGKIFEAVIFEQTRKNKWFGPVATISAASRFDDIVNKVDAMVEFPEEPAGAAHLALAMDVTVAERFGEKFDHIKNGIDRGTLTEIKYFLSEHLHIRGRKDKVPHVVIGVGRKTLYDIVSAWMRHDDRYLGAHPAQVKVLEETRLQLEAYADYARQTGKAELVPIFEKTRRIVQAIMKDKGVTDDDKREANKDDVFYAIHFNARRLADRQPPKKL